MGKTKVLKVKDGWVSSAKPLPLYFHRAAFDAYVAVRNGKEDVSLDRIQELCEFCLSLLKSVGTSLSAMEDEELCTKSLTDQQRFGGVVEELTGVLCKYDHDSGRYSWSKDVPGGSSLKPSQLMASFAFFVIDKAASAYLASDYEGALKLLGNAGLATSDYGFLYGFDDHDEMLKEESAMASRKRWSSMDAVRKYAVSRWNDGSWRSKRNCANTICTDVIAFAAGVGVRLSEGNAERTVYDWLRAVK